MLATNTAKVVSKKMNKI